MQRQLDVAQEQLAAAEKARKTDQDRHSVEIASRTQELAAAKEDYDSRVADLEVMILHIYWLVLLADIANHRLSMGTASLLFKRTCRISSMQPRSNSPLLRRPDRQIRKIIRLK